MIFFIAIAICHSVYVQNDNNKANQNEQLQIFLFVVELT